MIYYLVEFVLIFILSIIFYYFLFIKRSLKKNIKPLEIVYLQNTYKLNLRKITLKKLGKLVTIINSFIIALTVVIIDLVDNFFLQMLIGFVILILLTISIYFLVGKYYKQKGMTTDV